MSNFLLLLFQILRLTSMIITKRNKSKESPPPISKKTRKPNKEYSVPNFTFACSNMTYLYTFSRDASIKRVKQRVINKITSASSKHQVYGCRKATSLQLVEIV